MFLFLEHVAETIDKMEKDMRELVEYIIKKIANNPDKVKVQEKKKRKLLFWKSS